MERLREKLAALLPAPPILDEAHCGHCQKLTPHEFHSSDHERDSSGDLRRCKHCGWGRTGHSHDYVDMN